MKSDKIKIFLILISLLLNNFCSYNNLIKRRTNIEFTIMTYNVNFGVSCEGEENIENQANIIKNQNPDWVALQEIDNNCVRSGNINQAQYFGNYTNLNGIFGEFVEFDGGSYGMAVLSRFDILSTKFLTLPSTIEPKIAIIQIIQIKKYLKMALVNIHLDFANSKIQIMQIEKLINYLNKLNLPVIIAGDFNAEPLSPSLELLESTGFQSINKDHKRYTFNGKNPTLEIDHILYKNYEDILIQPVMIQVINDPIASDHRPIIAKIRITQN